MTEEETKPLSPLDPQEFSQIMEDCLSRLEDEGISVVEEFCRLHPQHAEKIHRRVSRLLKMGLLDGTPQPKQGLPDQLGDFKLGEILGSGGMGVVYQAEQQSVGRQVALKLIRPEHLFFPNARERFRREIDAVARLVHPGIVPIYAVGEEQGIPFFAMENIHGVTMLDLISHLKGKRPANLTGRHIQQAILECLGEENRPANKEARDFFTGSLVQVGFRIALVVAQALAHAHACGVLHRDVKPSNILITPEGRVLLFDFGLAHIEGGGELTRSGAQLGSLPYMAPELLRGDPNHVGAQVDVYGLGATLFEFLTLTPPYAHTNNEKLRQVILQGITKPIAKLNPTITTDVRSVCQKAIASDPTRRYPNAMDLARDLLNFLEFKPVSAHPPSIWYRSRRYAQRHPGRTTALAALLIAGTAGPLIFGIQEAKAAKLEKIAANQLRQALNDKEKEFLRAENNLVQARKEFQRAEENLAQARQAIDRMLTRVSEDHLARFPQMDLIRKALLKEAMVLLQKLEPDDPDEFRHGWEQARSTMLVAILQKSLGQMKESRKHFMLAKGRLEKLRDRGHKHPFIPLDLAQIHMQLGIIHRKTGQSKASYQETEKSVGMLEEFHKQSPKNWQCLHDLTISLVQLVNLELQRGKFTKADSLLARAIAATNSMVTLKAPGVNYDQASVLSTKGLRFHLCGNHASAKKYYTEALVLLQSIKPGEEQRESTGEFDLTNKIGDLHFNLAALDQQQGKFQIALEQARLCLASREKLLSFAPNRPKTQYQMAQASTMVADLLREMGKKREAITYFRNSMETIELLLRVYPRNNLYRRELGISCGALSLLVPKKEKLTLLDRSLAAQKALVADFPTRPQYRDDLGLTLYNRALVETDSAKRLSFFQDSAKQFRKEFALSPRLNPRRKRVLAFVLAEGAMALIKLGREQDALKQLTEAVRELGLPVEFLQQDGFNPLCDLAEFKDLLKR